MLALPATLLRRIPISPALPAQQHEAIARLKYGLGTKTLIQFARRFWRVTGRPRAFGSSLPFGAVWDGNEEQKGKPGILSLLAGGGASTLTQSMIDKGGMASLVASLDWLGAKNVDVMRSHRTVWEADPWVRGGYAYFDPSYDPALRLWLPRPFGRLFFAGEHTSLRWQGYMNGAIESGRRAAAEVDATHRTAALRSRILVHRSSAYPHGRAPPARHVRARTPYTTSGRNRIEDIRVIAEALRTQRRVCRRAELPGRTGHDVGEIGQRAVKWRFWLNGAV